MGTEAVFSDDGLTASEFFDALESALLEEEGDPSYDALRNDAAMLAEFFADPSSPTAQKAVALRLFQEAYCE